MEKEIVLYQEALILKDLGFGEECFGFFNVNGDFMAVHGTSMEQVEKFDLKECCLAPTYRQVFRWFRDVYHLEGWVTPYNSLEGKKYCIQHEYMIFPEPESTVFASHEAAELYLIQQLLKVIQNRKEFG